MTKMIRMSICYFEAWQLKQWNKQCIFQQARKLPVNGNITDWLWNITLILQVPLEGIRDSNFISTLIFYWKIPYPLVLLPFYQYLPLFVKSRYADVIVHRLLLSALKEQDWWSNKDEKCEIEEMTNTCETPPVTCI